MPTIEENIEALAHQLDAITDARKRILENIGDLINVQIQSGNQCHVLFICTHNSRRSLLAESWLAILSKYYDLLGLATYSCGTEKTFFHPNMMNAMIDFGFEITSISSETYNPLYILRYKNWRKLLYSKTFEDVQHDISYIALTVCSHAAEACPLLEFKGNKATLFYKDPKKSDSFSNYPVVYKNSILEIGREITYMVKYIKQFK